MIRFTSVIFAIVLALLAGCASIKQEAGFEVQSKSAQVLKARQEPWHNVAVLGDLRAVDEVAVAPVNLPEWLPTAWKEEFVDKSRTYTVKLSDGRLLQKPLERVVMRAAAYTKVGRFVEQFDAVITAKARAFFILLPVNQIEELKHYQIVILSPDASRLLTTLGEQVVLSANQDVSKLPSGFFAEHPSPLRQTVVIKRTHPVFRDLLETFPNHFTIRGVSYSGRPDTDIILSQFTSLETASDKIISCGSLAVSPGMVTFGLALSVVRNISVANQRDCLRGQ